MVFTSHIFLFYFLPFALFVYYLLPKYRNHFLLAVSYVFYGWWQPSFVLLMLAATVITFVGGKVIAASRDRPHRARVALVLSVTGSLGLLGFFKYFMFLEENLNRMVGLFGAGSLDVLRITLPIGISFYTFQSLSYVVDVYRNDSPPVRSFWDFACFVSLFPQLIAGPIVRYNTIADQLVERSHNMAKFSSGVSLFILGFARKLMLANPMGDIADAVFAAQSPMALDAWFGVTAYAFQIYFDFAGYSDMAIGLGRMVGFEFPRNFNAPYHSQGITEFWRRWHISLSTFLRDYLYIPLGGNRKGKRRTYVNLTVVMLLGGLWHGASWTFVIWGGFHGVMLAFERFLGKKTVYEWAPKPFRIGITFVLVLFSWVLFRSGDFGTAASYFAAMFGANDKSDCGMLLGAQIYSRGNLMLMALCGILVFLPYQAFDWVKRLTWSKVCLLTILYIMAILTMFTQSFNPFLYFQF